VNGIALWPGWGRSLPALVAAVLALFAYRRLTPRRSAREAACATAGVALLALAFVSPLATLAEGYLFSAHMVRHLLLLLVVPALLLLALPARPRGHPAAHGRPRGPVLVYWLSGLAGMWVWHEPALCSLAARSPLLQIVQAVSLLGLGAAFWWPVVGPRRDHHLHPLAGVVYLASACFGCTILGILITFAPAGAACPAYLQPGGAGGLAPFIRQRWGLTPLEDQQLGGLIMWVPACGIYLSGIVLLLSRYYRAPRRTTGWRPAARSCPSASMGSSGQAR
jgi:putative membrane protein